MALALVGLAPAVRMGVDPRLATRIGDLALAHPVGLAAGFDKNAVAVRGLARRGFAFVEIGTVTPRPQPGNPRPRLFRLSEDGAVINRLGFNNEGLAAVAGRLAALGPRPVPIGANVGMGRDAAEPVLDYVAGIERLGPHADYLVVNVSSPNTPGLRALQKSERLVGLLAPVVRARDALAGPRRPLLVKIAPDLDEADEAAIAEVALASGVDGLLISNTTVGRPAGLRSRHAVEAGGLSGRPLMGQSTALLARMRRRVGERLVLIGVGGIASAADAMAKIRAGASAVQVYTGLVHEGPGLVRRIVEALPALLDEGGFASLTAAIGADA